METNILDKFKIFFPMDLEQKQMKKNNLNILDFLKMI